MIRHSSMSPVGVCWTDRYVLYGSFHHILAAAAAAADTKGGLADLKVKICGRDEA
jgi:hypothetical protein